MNALRRPADQPARDAALDPQRSFIVQAPAGSGKTELLIQRYLKLLGVVAEPEEVLAITFTRKAAGEMRARVEAALREAALGTPPAEPHRALGYELAGAVLARDRQRGWRLIDFPTRLRISTIDAVNSGLARRVPLSAGPTSLNVIAEDPEPIYRAAIRETLLLAEEPGPGADSVRVLLAHCDNRADTAERYLQIMRRRRDQWLRRTGSGRDDDPGRRRECYEASLQALIEIDLRAAHAALPGEEAEPLLDLLRYAGESIAPEKPDSPLLAWRAREAPARPKFADIDLWRGMQFCLQTNEGTWRLRLDKNGGFPPGKGEPALRKAQAMDLLGRLADHEQFRTALYAVAALPDAHYTDEQWALIEALWRVLPLTVAMLKTTFADRVVTDYTEIAQEAVAALGNDDETSDLRLALDYQLKHILLDEFQDTSRSQFDLIERLVEGWELEADRSLFLVGDPMQSIYRFREAEVGLFLGARKNGIGGLQLEELLLTANFRSDPAIVDWFNAAFKMIFPVQEDATTGAVRFEQSLAMRAAAPNCGVRWHPVALRGPEAGSAGRETEANQIADLVADTLAGWSADPGAGAGPDERRIGILVRSRRHAVEIGRSLQRRSIAFTAMGLENLDEQSVVQDLVALTRALLHPGDRIAWLAVLRAPWCGLCLADLHALAGDDHDTTIWALMNDRIALARVSADGCARLDRCRPILAALLVRYGALGLRDLVESGWRQLGGPATLGAETDSELAIVDAFLELLGALEVDGEDGPELLRRLVGKSVTRGGSEAPVTIMTIHKAKGLEFDTVILPGLARRTRPSDQPPLLFHEFELDDGSAGLVVAPVAAGDQESDPIYRLLWGFEQQREQLEQDRLLYVAVTRARRNLHLFAALDRRDEEDPLPAGPAKNTLLGRLWPVAATQIDTTGVTLPIRAKRRPGYRRIEMRTVPLRRLPADWCAPAVPEPRGVSIPPDAGPDDEPVEFDWASTWIKHVGSVVHRWLQQIAEEGPAGWDAQRVAAVEPALRRALRRAGIGRDEERKAAQRVMDAINGTLSDPRGRWLLDAHDEAVTEWPITTIDADSGLFRNHIIDRMFVCADGLRWIVDYKTGTHEGADIDAFLRSEAQRYGPQLARYRDACLKIDTRPVRTALYFPLLQAFHVVDGDAL